MEHIKSYQSLIELKSDLHQRALKTPYVCAVSGNLNYNFEDPIYNEGDAFTQNFNTTFDGGGARASYDSGSVRNLNGKTVDRNYIPGREQRMKWKI